jgi:hypothetical protein
MERVVLALLVVLGCKSDERDWGKVGSGSAEPSRNAAAITILRDAIDQRYSHRDRLGLDWNQLFADATPALERAPSVAAFADQLVTLLAHAKDPHIWIQAGAVQQATVQNPAGMNASLAAIKKNVAGLTPHGRCLAIGRVADTIAYVLINGLENGRCDDVAEKFAAAYPSFAGTTGMIIDLRGNQGGNEAHARAITGHFIDKPVHYENSQVRDPTVPGGWREPSPHVVEPVAGVARYPAPVVVLSGPLCMSSCEAFLLMLRGAGATLVGQRSRGASANPQPFDLGNGLVVYIPSWRATLLDGSPLEGVGVGPDVGIAHAETPDLADPTLAAGIAAIRQAQRR